MKAERVDLLALKPDEKPLEFIDPSKRAFRDSSVSVTGIVDIVRLVVLFHIRTDVPQSTTTKLENLTEFIDRVSAAL